MHQIYTALKTHVLEACNLFSNNHIGMKRGGYLPGGHTYIYTKFGVHSYPDVAMTDDGNIRVPRNGTPMSKVHLSARFRP